MNPEGFFAFEGAALLLVTLWIGSFRSPHLRRTIRNQYRGMWLPYVFRIAPATAPLWSAFAALLGVLTLLPRGIGVWASLGVFDFGLVAVALTYHDPKPFLPAWLRREIETGVTTITAPDGWDRALLWLVVPLILLMNVGLPVLVFVYHEQLG